LVALVHLLMKPLCFAGKLLDLSMKPFHDGRLFNTAQHLVDVASTPYAQPFLEHSGARFRDRVSRLITGGRRLGCGGGSSPLSVEGAELIHMEETAMAGQL